MQASDGVFGAESALRSAPQQRDVSGGADFPSKNPKDLFGGGGGAGVTITPVAFLIISDGEVTLKHITAYDNAAERVVNLVPEMFDKVTSFMTKSKKDSAKKELPEDVK